MSKKHTNKGSADTFLRNFYEPGHSSITVGYLNWNLSLGFYQYSGKSNIDGFDRYDFRNGITTAVNCDDASYLYRVAMFILNDINSEKEIRAVLECNNAALIFEYKPDQNNQMASSLTIEKNNQSISFKFKTHPVQVRENGQMLTKVVQSGLVAFAKTIEGYLTGIGTDLHLSKLPDDFALSQEAAVVFDHSKPWK
jgi:hypothetical protein